MSIPEQENERHWWYYRKNGKVKGPFAAGLLSRYILLGRLALDDEVSHDKQTWRVVKSTRELIPDVMKGDMNDPFVRERLKAARRWADERYRGERRYSEEEQAGADRQAGDRRHVESEEEIAYRQHRNKRLGIGVRGENTVLGWLLLIASLIAIGYAGYFAYTHQSEDKPVDCNSAPAEGVNWRNCAMQGLNLQAINVSKSELNNANFTGADLKGARLSDSDASYTNFSLARLTGADFRNTMLLGANFRNASLRDADFSGADLSFANLADADITNIKLENANLSKAIWVDGQPCLQGSVGGCLR